MERDTIETYTQFLEIWLLQRLHMLAHEAVEYRRREEPASVGRRSALPLPPDTTHADAADALCALAQVA